MIAAAIAASLQETAPTPAHTQHQAAPLPGDTQGNAREYVRRQYVDAINQHGGYLPIKEAKKLLAKNADAAK